MKVRKLPNLIQDGYSNRSAAELATLEYTSLDILNTAIATVYGKSINTLLKEHWEDELKYFSRAYKQQSNTALASNNANQQVTTESQAVDVNDLIVGEYIEEYEPRLNRPTP